MAARRAAFSAGTGAKRKGEKTNKKKLAAMSTGSIVLAPSPDNNPGVREIKKKKRLCA